MDRDDILDTGATVATAAGIRQARRKFFRKVYRTLYSGVPKRVGPIVALGSIINRITKTASPYDYTQITQEGVMPSMIPEEYYEKTARAGRAWTKIIRGVKSRATNARAAVNKANNSVNNAANTRVALLGSKTGPVVPEKALVLRNAPAAPATVSPLREFKAAVNGRPTTNANAAEAANIAANNVATADTAAEAASTALKNRNKWLAFGLGVGTGGGYGAYKLQQEKTAASLAPMRIMRKDYLKSMLDYRRAASAKWEKAVANSAVKDAVGMIRSGEAAQKALKAAPTAQNYHNLIQESGIRQMEPALAKKLRHRYGDI